MSLGVVVRHRNNSDAQSPGLHNGPNGLTRKVPSVAGLTASPGGASSGRLEVCAASAVVRKR
jgi:hypothetical protein